jgi:ribosome-associated protein
VSAIVVSETVRVPESAITVRATRASGPGGQHVNKVATKIDLRVELAAIEGLSEAARRRLHGLVAHRLDADGRLVVTSQLTRTQSLNVEDARAKVRELIAAALVRPTPRRTTRPTRTSREQRIAGRSSAALSSACAPVPVTGRDNLTPAQGVTVPPILAERGRPPVGRPESRVQCSGKTTPLPPQDGVGSRDQERLPNPDRSERPRQPASPGSRDASP